MKTLNTMFGVTFYFPKKLSIWEMIKINILLGDKVSLQKVWAREKKSLVIKYFPPLPSSLLLTDHFSSVTLEFDFFLGFLAQLILFSVFWLWPRPRRLRGWGSAPGAGGGRAASASVSASWGRGCAGPWTTPGSSAAEVETRTETTSSWARETPGPAPGGSGPHWEIKNRFYKEFISIISMKSVKQEGHV